MGFPYCGLVLLLRFFQHVAEFFSAFSNYRYPEILKTRSDKELHQMVETCTLTKEVSLVSGPVRDLSEIFQMQTNP